MVFDYCRKYDDNQPQYNEFTQFPFPLSDFQKWSLHSIMNSYHTLVTAHTGCGKTLPAEFAIDYFTKQNKKVIYTSPIKALSNQKFQEFKEKFGDGRVGILTGDIKFNPEADILIMTTEILRNKLLMTEQTNDFPNISHCNFDMDVKNDCACVIFDEVHYIDNEDRGNVWEQSIMTLPDNIIMVMLSASIGNSNRLAGWIEQIKNRPVSICGTNHRIVPLEHISYFPVPTSIIDRIKNKQTKMMFDKYSDTFLMLKSDSCWFNHDNFKHVQYMKKYLDDSSITMYRKYTINKTVETLRDKGMLPALCFVLSRKQVQKIAQEISVNVFTEQELYDDPITRTMEQYCKQMLVSKVKNWKEYISTSEYTILMSCLVKGVGFHHAGMTPIFKEIVETLYTQKKIKFLVATETFSIGLNMPTKTVVFSTMYKYTDKGNRLFYGHEYTQMAGRAGRRNIDTIGYIVHLNGLYELPNSQGYSSMMNSTPKSVFSKFKMSVPYVLSLLHKYQSSDNTNENEKTTMTTWISLIEEEIKKSYMYLDIENQLNVSKLEINKINVQLQNHKTSSSYDEQAVKQVMELKELISMTRNKKEKKKIEGKLKNLYFKNPKIDKQIDEYMQIKTTQTCLENEHEVMKNANEFISNRLTNIFNMLQRDDFIDEHGKITNRGYVACCMIECHGLVMADIILNSDNLSSLDASEIAALLSCFYPLKQRDDIKVHNPNTENIELNKTATFIKSQLDTYLDKEIQFDIDVGYSYDCQYDLMNAVLKWCGISNAEQAKMFFHQYLYNECQIFPGEFSKCCLKIINCVEEIKNISEYLQFYDLAKKVEPIPELLMKFVVHNESIYI